MDLDAIYEKIIEKIEPTKVFRNEPMSKHTSFKTGGNADFFIKPTNVEEIQYLIELSKNEKIPLTIMGNGTNLLVKDGGVRGIVIKANLQNVEVEKANDEVVITAGAGVPLTKISKMAKENSATGLEFAVGIPGSLGGAVRMNAGAYGSEMKEVVATTTFIDYDGNVKKISNKQHEFEYRNSVFSKIDGVILETQLKLPIGNKEQIEHTMQENTKSRIEKQPMDKPNAGSTFKRGNGFITAKLIDECGLKGYQIGGAKVSTKHAGFIVNDGGATAKDILELSNHIKQEVNKKFNVDLELEIQVIGEE